MEIIGQEILLRNNTGNKPKSVIIDGFVVRTDEFNELRKLYSEASNVSEVTNNLIVGLRGAGKTTLMYRFAYALQDEKELSDRYMPILFSEEQYSLSDLTNLWETIAEEIEDNFFDVNLSGQIENIIESNENFELKSFQLLKDFLLDKRKIAVLFIENINFFLKKLSKEERGRFKKIITSDSPFRIIGSSTSFNDGTIDFGDTFFNFLNTVKLDGLTQGECKKLLLTIGEQYGEKEQIKKVIENHPARVETLRRLTGGVPRTISYLFQIFLDNENGKAIKDLYLLIDTLTLLYKSELDKLSTQQQKVIDAIAKKWDAISVKEIVKKTRLESKNVSSILAYLERNQLIEKIQTSKKNHLYRIKERFMNIWYLMRFGRKHDKDNVIWLVRFFDAWCDETELTSRIKNHIKNLKGGKYDAKAAIDMGNTFLSCQHISDPLKEELIDTTISILPKNSVLPNRLLKMGIMSNQKVLGEVKKLIESRDYDKASKLLEDVQDKNIDYLRIATSLYLQKGEHDKALGYASEAYLLDDKDPKTLVSLGAMYQYHLYDLDKAAEFYKKCLELDSVHPFALYGLGNISVEKNEYETAINYYLDSLSKNFKPALISLGELYLKLGDFNKAEQYYRDAVEAKLMKSHIFFGRALNEMGRPKEAEDMFIKAIEANEEGANAALGRFYAFKSKPNYKKAEKQFKEAMVNGDLDGYNELANLFIERKNLEQAIVVYKQGVEHGNAESAHQLGHVYSITGEFEESDKMFEQAIKLGDESSKTCWVKSIYGAQRVEKKALALEILRSHKNETKTNNLLFDILYARILLWNGNVKDSVDLIESRKSDIKSMEMQSGESKRMQKMLTELLEFFLLLIAKDEFNRALEFFNDTRTVDFKTMLKPIYFLLMEELKDEYPTEYLKAGKELVETISELKKEVQSLRG